MLSKHTCAGKRLEEPRACRLRLWRMHAMRLAAQGPLAACSCLCVQLLLQSPGIGLVCCCRVWGPTGMAVAVTITDSHPGAVGQALLPPCCAWRSALEVHLLLQRPCQRLIVSSAGRDRLVPVLQLLRRVLDARLCPQTLLQLWRRPASTRLPAGTGSTAPLGLHWVRLPRKGGWSSRRA